MKKIYFTFFGMATCAMALAQPTITSTQINPVIGEIIQVAQSNYIPDGANGSNITWDFSALSPTATATITMLASDAAHPGTNIVHDFGSGTKLYFQNDATGQNSVFQNTGGTVITFSDPMKILGFPLSSTTSFVDNFAATFTSGGTPFSRQGSSTFSYEGFGTIITPSGTFTDVIKCRLHQVYTDTYSAGTINYDTDAHYWYKAGTHYIIASSIDFTSDLQNIQYCQYYLSSNLGVDEESFDNFTLYPNPATDVLTLKSDNTELIESVTVFDLTGKVMPVEITQTPFGDTKLNLNELRSGTYLVQLRLNNGVVSTAKFDKK